MLNSGGYRLLTLVATLNDYLMVLFKIPGLYMVFWGFVYSVGALITSL